MAGPAPPGRGCAGRPGAEASSTRSCGPGRRRWCRSGRGASRRRPARRRPARLAVHQQAEPHRRAPPGRRARRGRCSVAAERHRREAELRAAPRGASLQPQAAVGQPVEVARRHRRAGRRPVGQHRQRQERRGQVDAEHLEAAEDAARRWRRPGAGAPAPPRPSRPARRGRRAARARRTPGSGSLLQPGWGPPPAGRAAPARGPARARPAPPPRRRRAGRRAPAARTAARQSSGEGSRAACSAWAASEASPGQPERGAEQDGPLARGGRAAWPRRGRGAPAGRGAQPRTCSPRSAPS